MAWDPKIYLAFDAERTRPAHELLRRIPADRPRRIADLGCGPGNSTALLAQRWPDAELEGVDSSPQMLNEARKTAIRARWTEADIEAWRTGAPCDVIFSNAALQWVAGHAALLPRLVSQLSGGGYLAFQVPQNFSEPCHTLIREVASDERWRDRLARVRVWWNVLDPEKYYDILEPHARDIDIWETVYLQVLEGEDPVYRWMTGSGLRPFADALDGDERAEFLDAYRKRAAVAYPRRANGTTLYSFRRLFCVARRKP